MKLDPKIRQRYDQTYMQLLAAVRVEVLEAKAPALAGSSPIAMMFFKESQKSLLQDLAQLVAAWNQSEINFTVIDRATSTLHEMGLETARSRLLGLKDLELDSALD